MFIVKVLQGGSPTDAQPIVVTSSPAVARAVGEAIAKELGADGASASVLKLLCDGATPGGPE